MKVKKVVGELSDVKVARLSLVDRGAIRVPFRMVKQEGAGVIDFGRIFKDAGDAKGPMKVTAVAVAAGAPGGVEAEVAASGFSVAQKSEKEGNALYLQVPEGEFDAGKCQAVRVGPGVQVLLTGAESVLSKAEASFKETLGEDKYIPGIAAAGDSFLERLDEAVEKGEGLPEALKSAVEDFYAYAAHAATLPASVLKLERRVLSLEGGEAAAPEPVAAPATPVTPAAAPVAEPAAQEPAAPAKADAPAEPVAPAPAPVLDAADLVSQVVQALEPRFAAIEVGVAAAKSEAEKARDAARGQASLPAPPADPQPLQLRGVRAGTSKHAVPLLDTYRDRVSD